mmetsp:Transcript_16695/g.49919  ORF Transcript_16695/g.49919 Transcript_16695/m.49919 type:complete len:149 (+) Transcript_16695:162-608(+)|eukprot:CAMPEP_0206134470 /NCGR_PEP_ID=MMETSP1473-20131121/25_1 /ASSEMBLY_ACC=CAM_ASM_001109 /TAXON_ID=1461547 /ORGANISM="Stichococcus sp, Strain RCC1054" /LENGTH=148 /DNA_ID=CAMNT_0053526077 /DNA_START=143 /DNA_END=589 /DNA_ORIENTATION=-
MGRLNITLSAADLSSEASVITLEALSSASTVAEPAEIRCQNRDSSWTGSATVEVPTGARALRVTILDGAGAELASAEHPLAAVKAADTERADMPLRSADGAAAGSVTTVLRLFHGRAAPRTGGPVLDNFASMHRQMNRAASLKAQMAH